MIQAKNLTVTNDTYPMYATNNPNWIVHDHPSWSETNRFVWPNTNLLPHIWIDNNGYLHMPISDIFTNDTVDTFIRPSQNPDWQIWVGKEPDDYSNIVSIPPPPQIVTVTNTLVITRIEDRNVITPSDLQGQWHDFLLAIVIIVGILTVFPRRTITQIKEKKK